MHVRFDIDHTVFDTSCNVLISGVPKATRKLVDMAGQEILQDSNRMVPKETTALMKSGYYEVSGSYTAWDVTIGYADPVHDQLNPKSNKLTSEYVVVVHEDLLAGHTVGEAKFLEKAFINWVTRYPRIAKQVFSELGL